MSIRGFRPAAILLATTLLDPIEYPVAELAGLYLRRWRVELFLRDSKTTLQMEMLSCKSPALVRKELLMHLIACNLIRCVMVEAASLYELAWERISFKGALETCAILIPASPPEDSAPYRHCSRSALPMTNRSDAAIAAAHTTGLRNPSAAKGTAAAL